MFSIQELTTIMVASVDIEFFTTYRQHSPARKEPRKAKDTNCIHAEYLRIYDCYQLSLEEID